MTRTAPVILLTLALAGCNEKDLDSIPRSFAAPELERAAGNLACRTQEELTERADIAVRGADVCFRKRYSKGRFWPGAAFGEALPKAVPRQTAKAQ